MEKGIFILILWFFSLSLGQNKKVVYLDHDYSIISQKKHKKKLNSELYHSLTYDLDTIVYNKLRLNHFFGKLESKKKSQLFALLKSRVGIDTTKSIVVHYTDLLKRKEEFTKEDKIEHLSNGRHRHLISYKTFLNQHKKCHEKFSKYKTTVNVYHFYKVNNGHPNKLNDLIWYEDPSGIIKRIFSDRHSNFKNFIIKPNGEYFVYSLREFKSFKYDDIFLGNWNKQKERFIKRYNKINKK